MCVYKTRSGWGVSTVISKCFSSVSIKLRYFRSIYYWTLVGGFKKDRKCTIFLFIMPAHQVGARSMSSHSSEDSFGEERTVPPLFSQMTNNSHGLSPVALWFHSLVLAGRVLRVAPCSRTAPAWLLLPSPPSVTHV